MSTASLPQIGSACQRVNHRTSLIEKECELHKASKELQGLIERGLYIPTHLQLINMSWKTKDRGLAEQSQH